MAGADWSEEKHWEVFCGDKFTAAFSKVKSLELQTINWFSQSWRREDPFGR